MAAKEHEQADVNLAGLKLKREVAKWKTYNDSVEVWQCRTELQKRVQLTGRDQKNQKRPSWPPLLCSDSTRVFPHHQAALNRGQQTAAGSHSQQQQQQQQQHQLVNLIVIANSMHVCKGAASATRSLKSEVLKHVLN